jgi:Glycosyltransferase
MSKNEMPLFYESIDILLMSSQRSESLGLVTLEAMSCGKPVICFNKFAFPEFVISGVTGELVDYSQNDDNVDGFINAIERVVKSYKNYHPRDIVVNKYSCDYVIAQYKEMFK